MSRIVISADCTALDCTALKDLTLFVSLDLLVNQFFGQYCVLAWPGGGGTNADL